MRRAWQAFDDRPLVWFLVGLAAILSAALLALVLRPAPPLVITDEHGNNLVYYCPGDARCNPTPWPTTVRR